ncbi:MAG: hypothetical protein WAU01_16945, partial [Saprospiraceae bacterium]
LPKPFVDAMSCKLSADELDEFVATLSSDAPVSIRQNKYKNSNQYLPSEQVSWCPTGLYLSQRPKFTLDPHFHAGAYYVQEASSMIIWSILEKLNLSTINIRVLDLCASPGGKSTLIASFLDKKGLLVSNEMVKNRAYTLKYNMCKEGYANVVVTNNAPSDFSRLSEFFDVILVDAPCSGEGLFRKNNDAIGEWSPDAVEQCATRQEQILQDIVPCLKPGGHLIYSTCTYNDAENINNVHWACENFDFRSIAVDFPESWQVVSIAKGKSLGYQCYPHKLRGEGLFVSVLQKHEDKQPFDHKVPKHHKIIVPTDPKWRGILDGWLQNTNFSFWIDKMGTIHAVPLHIEQDLLILAQYLKLIYCGISMGVIKNKDLIPDHSLALSLDLSKKIVTHELSERDALHYLKKQLTHIECPTKGWLLMTYNGLGLGWAKNIGDRINNYLPADYKIHMEID